MPIFLCCWSLSQGLERPLSGDSPLLYNICLENLKGGGNLKAGVSDHQRVPSPTCSDAGCWLGPWLALWARNLHVASSCGCSSFFTSWWLGSESKHSKRARLKLHHLWVITSVKLHHFSCIHWSRWSQRPCHSLEGRNKNITIPWVGCQKCHVRRMCEMGDAVTAVVGK